MCIWEGFFADMDHLDFLECSFLPFVPTILLVMWIVAISIIVRYLVPKSVGCKIVSVIPSLS